MAEDDRRLIHAASTRGAKTRAAILDAGRVLFAEHPMDAVAIDDIVRTAAVGKGSFYYHFDSKDSLLSTLVGEIRGRIEDAVIVANAAELDPASRVARAICVTLRFAQDDPTCATLLTRNELAGDVSKWSALYADAYKDIQAGMSDGQFSIPDVEAGVIVMVGAARLLQFRLTVESVPMRASELSRRTCAMILLSLGVSATNATALADAAVADILGS